MKRTLLVIRHAKSSWANPLQTDFERPLNERGEHDAPMMGKRLKALKIFPEMIISSTAKRAKQTAKRIAAEVNYDKSKIKMIEKLYHCIPPVFDEVISDINDSVKTAFIVAHNPGVTDYVNKFSEKFNIDNMPTCGIVGIRFEVTHWSDYKSSKKEVFLFEYPKKQYDSK